MKFAAIDIGSNTVLLLITKIVNGKFTAIAEKMRTPRLGKGVDALGNLDSESMENALKALEDYKKIITKEDEPVSKVIVTATSAVRDAHNKNYFLEEITHRTGFDVQVLSGHEEANYTYAGALHSLQNKNGYFMVIDIGGGSTEICYGNAKGILDRHSFNMGSVRFTEKYFSSPAPSAEEITACRKAVTNLLSRRSLTLTSGAKLVGVAGTVTSLAHIVSGRSGYDAGLINSTELKLQQIADAIEELTEKGAEYFLKKYPLVMQGRSDVFLGGLLILEQTMEYYQKKELLVSTGGIRQGAIIENFIT